MEYVMSNQNRGLRVHLSGQFTFADNNKFKHILESLEQEAPQSLNLNLSAVDFIDSAALGMLLLLRDRCQQQNVSLAIEEAQGQVEKIMMISKFDQLFKMR